MDELELDLSDDESTSNTSSWSWIELGNDDVTSEPSLDEDIEEEINEDEKSETKESEDEEVDLDLDNLFSELDDAKESIDKIESNKSWNNSEEVSLLKQTLSNMEWLLKKLTNEKTDLMYKNAELSTFWSEDTDPKILLLSRNLGKAKEWDDKAKTKTVSLLKDMLYDLTGEDFDQSKINKDIDMLSAVESYNTISNPKLKAQRKQEEEWLAM